MKESICHKLDQILKLKQSLQMQLSDQSVVSDMENYQRLSKELHQVLPVADAYERYLDLKTNVKEVSDMLLDEDADSEMKAMAQDELDSLHVKIDQIVSEILHILIPVDPDDKKNVYLEIRAGTGGDEASIFSGDLYRMYQLFAQSQGWRWQTVSSAPSDQGGFKEVVVHVVGQEVFSKLKYESGTHRVQRVPQTESQGRIHTSACTVAILPEVCEIDAIDLDPSDIRVDTYRSSGAGGQHVNTTDSAVRLTHIPTGTVVECQDERSQHKNKARAMSLLQARILSNQREKQHQERSEQRRLQVGSGDRSERIRTYNFPQGRVSDHRINLTLYKLDLILEGSLLLLIEPLQQQDSADKIADLQS
ncbi:MAG: peptide chain release factor 1 [Pseudomonadota bacterium]|nr:peptide chain release factor 1 [Pseudomonadota bacterium]